MTIVRNVGVWVLLFGALYLLDFVRFPLLQLAAPRPNPAQPGQEATEKRSVEGISLDSIRRQRLVAAKLARKQFLATGEAATRAIEEWNKELTGWEAEGPPLLKNEEGKRVAKDPEQARRFRGLIRTERPTRDEMEMARKSVEDIVSPIRDSESNPEDASMPENQLSWNLETLQAKAKTNRDSYREARAGVRGMLAKVRGMSPAEKTLDETLAVLDQEDAAERAAANDRTMKQAKDEAAKLIAEANAKLVKEAAEAEAATKANEAAKKRQETELANARTVQEMKLRQKEAENQIAHLEDAQEQRRIGDLKTGSKWKGQFKWNAYPASPITLTVTSRNKDDITGLASSNGAGVDFPFSGKVIGNRLKLTPRITGGTKLELVFSPTNKTMIGNMLDDNDQTTASLNVRLVEE